MSPTNRSDHAAFACKCPREFALLVQQEDRGNGKLQNGKKENGSLEEKAAALKLEHRCSHQAPEQDGNCLGFAARDKSGQMAPFRFPRRKLQPNDVRLQIAFCGVCHSDYHKIKSEWKPPTKFPCVPGHEIVGIVTEVGSEVAGFSVGDRAAVGCMVGSCGSCEECKAGLEQYCNNTCFTYDSEDPVDGSTTKGGYSTHIVLPESFALHLPTNLPMDAAAPLLCAGITTYSPLRHYGLDKPGMKVGVVGLGGLGHMAVKFLKSFGCEVTVISTSPGKKEEALSRLGAHHFLVSKDPEAMSQAAATLHGILDTVSAQHNLESYMSLLKTDGKLVMVGLPPEPLELPARTVIPRRKLVAGSMIGGIKETQEMLDFCGKHNIVCDIERIDIDYINTAMERLVKNDVRYRFVIDIQRTLVA